VIGHGTVTKCVEQGRGSGEFGGGRPVDYLMVPPAWEDGVSRPVDRVEANQAGPGDFLDCLFYLLVGHVTMVGEGPDAHLGCFADDAPLVVGLGQEYDPHPEGSIPERAHLAMLRGLRFDRADSRHRCQLSIEPPPGAAVAPRR
jgi:hypothetical protein